MKAAKILSIVCLCLLFRFAAFSQVANWGKATLVAPASTFGTIAAAATAMDTSGTFVGYNGNGSILLEGQVIPASDSLQHVTIAQYSEGGALVSVKRIVPQTTNNSVQLTALKIDQAGNLYALGSFLGNLTVNGTVLVGNNNNRDYFIMRWNPSGALTLSTSGGGVGFRQPQDLAIDAAGNMVMTGFVEFESNFGQILFPAGNRRAFVAKLSSSGTVQWVVGPQSSAVTNSSGYTIGLDQAGNIYADGTFSGSFVWGNIAHPAGNSQQSYWVKLTAGGQPITSFARLQPPFSDYNCMVVDNNGFSYLANVFTNTLDVGGISLSASPGEQDGYVAKYDPNGVLQWVTHLNGMIWGSKVLPKELALDNAGKLYLTGGFDGDLEIGTVQLTDSNGTGDAFAAAFDVFAGNTLWAFRGHTGSSDMGVAVSTMPDGQIALAGDFRSEPISIAGITVGSQVPLNQNSAYLVHVLQAYNLITGAVFVDWNGNGSQDAGEGGHPNQPVVEIAPPQLAANTNTAGIYQATVSQGAFSVSLPNPPPYYNVIPSGLTNASFSSFGNTSANHNFALQPIPNQLDLRVIVTPLMPARPGFPTAYRITYSNPGTVAIPAGTVTLSLDPQFTYLSSVPSGAISGTTLTWNYANLLPGQTRNINVNLSLPTSAVVGNPVTVTASVFPVLNDLTPADNAETNTRPITASYDPNLIQVNHEELALQQVQNGQWLEYTIHFQNLGTDTAFTVMIRDSLQTNLYKMGTIELRGASHSCSWSVNSAGVMTILFTNIRLPHQGANVLGSHGFIRFRIKPQNTLNVGAVIPNRARIYFDYNPAIITNLAETEVVQFSSAAGFLSPDLVQLFPNPAADAVTVKAISGRFAEVNLRLLNVLGQEVFSKQIQTAEAGIDQEISLRGLPSGVYSVQLQTEIGSVIKRLVKQ